MEAAEEWFIQWARHVSVAGACRAMARQDPNSARGLIRAADKHSEDAAELMEDAMNASGPVRIAGVRAQRDVG